MEISGAFAKFEHLLSELEGMGYEVVDILLDATGGSTPMRLGAALGLSGTVYDGASIHAATVRWWRTVGGGWIQRSGDIPDRQPAGRDRFVAGRPSDRAVNRRDYPASALVFKDIVQKVTGVGAGTLLQRTE
jgi:hypothetical protein